MKVKSFKGMTCSIAGALEWVGDRWTMLILRDLFIGLSRFEEFRESLDIPPTTLSDRLKRMVEHGIVEKRPYQKAPLREEFILTPKGRDFWPILLSIAKWGDRHDASGAGAPPMRFVSDKSGSDVMLKLIDENEGTAVRPSDIHMEAGPAADAKVHWRLTQGRSHNPREA
ncbi:winged helix-turn-helix transcriptional regulator [Erythrobacter mangrovi]|uniref:Helix-turn-helix transcriptional regulator n=1 Tax=Erythrobacter mangrovi TaxID=2739433 RepID=A0A7D3XYN4_9SPHN|nr:helix-turn-helix domain-containing protein [Erythrobacter mangrovi]QKG70652.1 helix-turn-helix transcriptional regulator [Erythrobacter mangrovi]